jgi:uncharacterized protein YegP (UPF0339 family)
LTKLAHPVPAPAHFELFRDEAGNYRWRLIVGDVGIAAGHGSHYSDWNADRSARAFKRNAAQADYSYRKIRGRWYWESTSPTGRPLATCVRPYATKWEARRSAEQARRWAASAIGP